MDLLPQDSLDDPQQLLLIRLPKEIVEASRSSATGKVGSLYIYDNGLAEIEDEATSKVYTLMRNSPNKRKNNELNASGNSLDQKHSDNHEVANEESDLFKISIRKDEAVHLGKIKFSTLLAVPKVDGKDVLTAHG